MTSTTTRQTSNPTIDEIHDTFYEFRAGGLAYDAFARFRTSTPTTLFESKQIVSEQDLLWDHGQVSGAGGTFVYSRPRASSTLTQAALSTGRYVRRTRRYFNYQPGKGQFILMSAILGNKQAGIHRRIGYFDEDNGIYFGVNEISLFCAVRSSVTGVPIDVEFHQADWNVDKLDGTGRSGYVLDTSVAQIYWFDFEWLGVGRVRWGVFIDGIPVLMHEMSFANHPLATSVYMSTPALPMSVEIENDGTGEESSVETICNAIISEGGERLQGVARSVSRGVNIIQVSNPNFVPILSLRAREQFQFTTINILNIDIICLSNQSTRWALILNPTFAGTDGAVWTPVPSSTAEFDITRTQALTITSGTIIDEGYVSQQGRQFSAKVESFLGLGKRLLPTSPRDQFVLAVQPLAGNNIQYLAAMQYEEST